MRDIFLQVSQLKSLCIINFRSLCFNKHWLQYLLSSDTFHPKPKAGIGICLNFPHPIHALRRAKQKTVYEKIYEQFTTLWYGVSIQILYWIWDQVPPRRWCMSPVQYNWHLHYYPPNWIQFSYIVKDIYRQLRESFYKSIMNTLLG